MDRIFALTPVPTVVLDPSLHIVQASATWLELFRVNYDDCLNNDFFDVTSISAFQGLMGIIKYTIETSIKSKSPQSTPDLTNGDARYWRFRSVPIVEKRKFLYFVFDAMDTTSDFLKQEALNAQLTSAETYRTLVSTVKEYAIFKLDPTGHIATWNAGAAILKQYSSDEIIGKHFSQLYSRDDQIAQKPEKELEIALREGKVEDEGWRIKKDGTRFWANVVITPIIHDGTLMGFSKVTRDLTERRAAEAQLIAAYEEAAKLKSDFLANMSHEIRTPMHGMLSALSLLIDTGLGSGQQELADIMEESGSILMQVINDILDYSKLSSGVFSISKEVINIPEIVSAVRRCFKVGSQAALRFEVEIDPHLPRFVQGDPLRYRQVLQNLVSNAVKFTEGGYIRINVILSHEDRTAYQVTTEVTDTGIGVPTETATLLFTPFTQLDNSATKRFQGTGLGLSICKSLTELMGGVIGYRPNPERQGSTFFFTTIFTKLDTPVSKPSVTAIQHTDINQAARDKQLLLVEDNNINQTIMLRLLRSFGFDKIDVASDGLEAVNLLKNKPLTYSLALMDISMPVLDGVAATREIRALGISLPIIAMTANALKGDEEAYLTAGMDDYVAKPVDRRLLLDILLRWLN